MRWRRRWWKVVRWRRYFGEDIFEGDILENLVEGKRRKEKGKRKRNEMRRYFLDLQK